MEAYGFDISLNFDYQLGGKIYDTQYASLMSNWVLIAALVLLVEQLRYLQHNHQ